MIKFICQKEILIKELSAVQKVISSKNNITILSNVLLEVKDDVLKIHACDAHLRFETEIPVKVVTQGKITVFADKLFNVIKTLPSAEIEFTAQEDKLTIMPVNRTGLNIQLRWLSSDGFPMADEPEGSTYFRLLQKDFIHMIKQTFFAVSKDETRIFMNGVLLKKADNKLTMVATDGRRLSLIEMPSESVMPDFKGVILHPKFLTIIRDLACGEGELSLALSEKTIYAQFDNTKISATLINDQFPDYKSVIPNTQNFNLRFNRIEFLDSLRRTAVFSNDKYNSIFLYFSPGKLEMVAEDTQIGGIREQIDCNYQGEMLKMALNHICLYEPLNVMTCDNFHFQFTKEDKAVTLCPENDKESLHVIMPLSPS